MVPNPCGMYTLGLDTIEGAKLLQVKFGAAGSFQPDQAVMHEDERARFIPASDGAAIIRHSGDRHPVTVPLESLSLPAEEPDDSGAHSIGARRAGVAFRRQQLRSQELGRLSRPHPHRPALRP